MEVVVEQKQFPMKIRCETDIDERGLSWHKKAAHCGSVLLITEEDLIAKRYRRGFKTYIDYGIVCPICGCFVVVNKISPLAQEIARRNKYESS